MSHMTSLGSHCDQLRRVAREIPQRIGKIFAEMVVVEHDPGGTAPFEYAGVQFLLPVAMEGIRNEDRRASRKGDLGNSHRTRARDNEVGAVKCAGYVVDKRNDTSLAPETSIPVRHQPHVSLSRLMSDGQLYNKVSADFESVQDSEIETMRAA